MNQLWYHIRKLALVILPVVLTVAPAMAQLTAYQGQTTELRIVQQTGDTYTWELYNDSTVNFATVSGHVPSDEAYFIDGINSGTAVRVAWLEPGTYFYKVTAVNATACTNNLKIGRITILDEQQSVQEPPVANDDYFIVDCDPIMANITDNDSWDHNFNVIVTVLEPPVKGNFDLDEDGQFSYAFYFNEVGKDSLLYELCMDTDSLLLCDTAWVHITIPEGLDCYNQPVPDDTTCHFFIPEGFSPNGDGVHDFFVVDCITRYPDAKLMVFDKQGYLLYEKENYGNPDVWGFNEADLWWGGQTTKNHHNDAHMVVPGVYIYILNKGNGDFERGFVMVAYGKDN